MNADSSFRNMSNEYVVVDTLSTTPNSSTDTSSSCSSKDFTIVDELSTNVSNSSSSTDNSLSSIDSDGYYTVDEYLPSHHSFSPTESSTPYVHKPTASALQHKSPPTRPNNNNNSASIPQAKPNHNQPSNFTSQQKRIPTSKVPYSRNSNTAARSTQQKNKKVSPIINLSSRVLNADERKVLELGLTFCPSIQHYNKEQLAEDFYMFIRRLKLTEYFTPQDTQSQHHSRLPEPEEDQSPPKYTQTHSDWYPDEVRNHRSPALVDFVNSVLKDTKHSLNSNANTRWNNMDNTARAAIVSLANDNSIIIKPSDKCGSIVIMNKKDYEEAALNQLTNTEYYEELPDDPNSKYKEEVASVIGLQDDIPNSVKNIILQGETTPVFYGLPKCHKVQGNEFPQLRPISSGHSSCTKNLSLYLDSFLKCAAQKTDSYIKDTTHFINRLAGIRTPTNSNTPTFLVSMDVISLYPNIDQQEGAEAAFHFMEQRRVKSIPSTIIKKLILLVLRSHTMNFLNRFFHQIKGTAMGTPMAVNFANLFMSKFEQDLLAAYQKEHKTTPLIWIRFIDDIFFIWHGDEASLKHFLNFCNNFAKNSKMSSTIRFTYSYSQQSVNFLDTTVKLETDGTISTTLFSKPTAAHNYLHSKSYHYPKSLRSIPKSQFIRIRRICTHLQDYWVNANQFIEFFSNRGYNQQNLIKCASEIANTPRDSYLKEQLKPRNDEKGSRTPLVVSWHHKFKGIADILHYHYNRIASHHPQFKETFPEPPIVAYRRAINVGDKIIRAKHWTSPRIQNPPKRTRSLIDSNLNRSGTIINPQNQRSATIPTGSATDTNVIYAAQCTKHKLLYIGMTGGALSTRFTGHRSDIIYHPDRCELPKHFKENGCDFSTDLEVSILEHVKGGEATRLLKEDKWINRLGTLSPNGLNQKTSEFMTVHKSLF